MTDMKLPCKRNEVVTYNSRDELEDDQMKKIVLNGIASYVLGILVLLPLPPLTFTHVCMLLRYHYHVRCTHTTGMTYMQLKENENQDPKDTGGGKPRSSGRGDGDTSRHVTQQLPGNPKP